MVGPNLNSATAAGKHTKKLIPRSQPKSSMAFGPDPATNHHGDNKTEAILVLPLLPWAKKADQC